MLNKLVIGFSIVAGIAIIGLGVFIYNEFTDDETLMNGDKTEESKETEEEETAKEVAAASDTPKVNKDHSLYTNSKTESDFQQNIHEMTHQKVSAQKKWGSLQMTDAQIEGMLAKLDEVGFENEDYYRDVLTAWKEGNFDNVVRVHNKIWSIQGGTVGRAKGRLTSEEEQQYIKSNF